MNSNVISGIILVLLLTITISDVSATEVERVTVESGDVGTVNFFLEKGKRFKGSLTMVAGNKIDFWIIAPSEAEDRVVSLSSVDQEAEFEFVTKESGTYLCVFSNVFSAETATIDLSYDISDIYNPIKITINISTLVLIVVGLATIIIIIIYWKS